MSENKKIKRGYYLALTQKHPNESIPIAHLVWIGSPSQRVDKIVIDALGIAPFYVTRIDHTEGLELRCKIPLLAVDYGPSLQPYLPGKIGVKVITPLESRAFLATQKRNPTHA